MFKQRLQTKFLQVKNIINCWILNPLINIDNHSQLGHVSVNSEKCIRNLLIYRHLLHRDFHSWQFVWDLGRGGGDQEAPV